MRLPTMTILALSLVGTACARKQQAQTPAPTTGPATGDDFADAFEDDSSFDDVFADDPSLGADLGADPFATGAVVGDPSLDVQPGEATTATVGGGGDLSSLMMLQSLPAMMQAMQTGNPQAMLGMMTQVMGSQGGTGGQIMQLAAPMIQQAVAQGAMQAQQQAAFGGASCGQ